MKEEEEGGIGDARFCKGGFFFGGGELGGYIAVRDCLDNVFDAVCSLVMAWLV